MSEQTLRDTAASYFRSFQDLACAALQKLDGSSFREDRWERPGGGGGITRVLENGALFEKAGVSTSAVFGDVPEALAGEIAGEGADFFATGISVVLHPRSPHVPSVHANFRLLCRGARAWFGGGSDLSPSYPRREDVVHFHRTWKSVCDQHDQAYYPRFKKWCDEYFALPHRQEMRGVGGIFFDQLPASESVFSFVRAAAETFLPAYAPIAERRAETPWNERERLWQLHRRGRYAEFNLLCDRGTTFGLRSGGRIESVMMSMPPVARWGYDVQVLPGSAEELSLRYFQPRDWLEEN